MKTTEARKRKRAAAVACTDLVMPRVCRTCNCTGREATRLFPGPGDEKPCSENCGWLEYWGHNAKLTDGGCVK
jgi:hypothetical protein